MLYYLSQQILALARHTSMETWVSPLRLFSYITFRSAGAAVASGLSTETFSVPSVGSQFYVATPANGGSNRNTGVSAAPTALGTFPVYLRFTSQTMSGTEPDGTHYSDPGIPWVSYFNGGDALHGFIRSSYGWPQSLGCVEMPFASAATVWPHTPIGTLVTVRA